MRVSALFRLGPLIAGGVLGTSMVILATSPSAGEVAPAAAVPAAGVPAVAAGETPGPGGPGARPSPPKFPELSEVIKDMDEIPGLVTLYRFKPDDPSKDPSRLLCRIPKSLMGQDLLLASSFSRGEMAGFPGNEYLIRFETLGKNVVVVTPDARFVRPGGNQPMTDVISRTYGDGFLAALPILTVAGADPVVDLGSALLDSTLAGMSTRARRDLSTYSKIKSFPDNTLIEVDLAISGAGAGGGRMGVYYALRKLPETRAYSPRAADERVGYFTTTRQDWGIKHTERDVVLRYINRWNLKKKDPSLELSPPEQPIVFIIEKTVPLRWRKYVAEGIREWNVAFEKLGFVEAVVVQQQTEDNEYANIDPEDARYNFLRWVVTGSAFAMGPSRADPRTGQILDADIIFDDSFVRALERKGDIFGIGPASAVFGPELATFMAANPAFVPMGHTVEEIIEHGHPGAGLPTDRCELTPTATSARQWMQERLAQSTCGYASGLQHQLSFANFAAAAAGPGKQLPEKLLGETIREIVTHEVGHTLGLRHNFKASTWLTLEEMKRRRDETDEPTAASVMDYNAVLFFDGDDPEKLRHIMTPTVGPYDCWAIEYGYKVPGKGDGDEKSMLAKIASRCTERELAYATDEDTTGLTSPDPFSNRYDVSDDPVAWAKDRAKLCDTLLKDLKKWAVKEDEPNEYLRSTFETIMREKAYNLFYAARMIGGQHFNRNRAGDPNARPALELIDPQKQRDVLAALNETIFNCDFFAVETSLLNDLGPSRWSDWASRAPSRVDYPIHQTIGSLQSYALLSVCSPQALQRVYDAELKSTADNKFTAAELIMSVRKSIWGELAVPDGKEYSDAEPMLCSIRRNLQVQHLRNLLAIADSPPGALVSADLQNLVRYALRDLGEQIGKLVKGGSASRLDFATKAHLVECKSQIDRVLDAPQIKTSGGSIIILGQTAAQQQAQQE